MYQMNLGKEYMSVFFVLFSCNFLVTRKLFLIKYRKTDVRLMYF